MRIKLKLVPILCIIIACILISCGTVHQFIPPQPLKPNEFRGVLTFSYDSNIFAPLGSWGASFYWGAGKDVNIGWGYQPPVGISHLTAIKYINPDKSTSERVYASLNDVMPTMDVSPNIEIGAGLTVKKGSTYHALSTGLWTFIDDKAAQPLWTRLLDAKITDSEFHPRIRPLFKYNFDNGDYSLSLEHYPGLTASAINFERRKLENRERIVLSNGDIVSVDFDPRSSRMSIKKKDSTEYRITPFSPYVDQWWPDMDLLRLKRFNPKDSWNYYFVQKIHIERATPSLYELDFNAIWLGYVDKQDIVLGSFPARKREIFKMIRWYKHDWSIGLGMKM